MCRDLAQMSGTVCHAGASDLSLESTCPGDNVRIDADERFDDRSDIEGSPHVSMLPARAREEMSECHTRSRRMCGNWTGTSEESKAIIELGRNGRDPLKGATITMTMTMTATMTREEQTARERAVIARLIEMHHVGYAETGITEVWSAAHRGFGRLLVVEESYRAERSRAIGNTLLPADGDAVDAMDDPVHAVIDMVRGSGGAVVMVAPGSLEDLGRIGLITGRSR